MRAGSQPELGGKVAVVSGGSGGIGGAIADELARRGALAVSLDVRPPAQEGAAFVEADVTDDEAVGRALERIAADRGGLDLVVHAAGITRDRVCWKQSMKDWDRVQAVNLRGAFSLLRHAVPLLRARGGGRVVLIGSINGSRGKFGQTAYAASKAGLIGLAKSAARETARFEIRVNVVEPGMVRTRMTEALPEKFRREAEVESLFGAMAEPADVARAVAFLCGPGGRMVTGHVLRVDGGQYL